jgi:hypothetical protein
MLSESDEGTTFFRLHNHQIDSNEHMERSIQTFVEIRKYRDGRHPSVVCLKEEMRASEATIVLHEVGERPRKTSRAERESG